MDKKTEFIRQAYRAAVDAGFAGSQQDWADALGVNRTTLSAAMNGNPRALTDKFMHKVRKWVEAHGLTIDGEAPAEQPAPSGEGGVFIPEKARVMFENMTEALRWQAQMLAAYQMGASPAQPWMQAQKNDGPREKK